MKRRRPILIVASIAAAGFCVPVFFAAQFFASVVVFRLLEVAGIALPPTGLTGVTILGQFLSMLIAMGMTYATFAGLRWVWRGTNFAGS